MNKYYVYGCYVDGVLRYVGYGQGSRYKHCNSGTSSCSELNRDFHAGKILTVEKLHTKLSKEQAVDIEAKLIEENFDLLYNKVIRSSRGNNPSITKKGDEFKVLAHTYSTDAKEIEFYENFVSDLGSSIFRLEERLLEDGLGVYIVQHGKSKPMVVVDKVSDGVTRKFIAHNYSHVVNPYLGLMESLSREAGND